MCARCALAPIPECPVPKLIHHFHRRRNPGRSGQRDRGPGVATANGAASAPAPPRPPPARPLAEAALLPGRRPRWGRVRPGPTSPGIRSAAPSSPAVRNPSLPRPPPCTATGVASHRTRCWQGRSPLRVRPAPRYPGRVLAGSPPPAGRQGHQANRPAPRASPHGQTGGPRCPVAASARRRSRAVSAHGAP